MAFNSPLQIHDSMVFRLSRKRSPSEVNLRSLEWAIVTQLNGEKTVGKIAEILALTREEAHSMFTRLMQEGLLEIVTTGSQNHLVPREMIGELEKQFTLCMGPVAAIVLDDILSDMKRTRDNIEKERFSLLIELVGLEVSNDSKRHEFQKQMLKKVREMMV